jgi:hypothetical protein
MQEAATAFSTTGSFHRARCGFINWRRFEKCQALPYVRMCVTEPDTDCLAHNQPCYRLSPVYPYRVRKLRTSLVVSTAMLAAAHAFATLEVAPTRNLQAAEAQAQETVKLSISGMT